MVIGRDTLVATLVAAQRLSSLRITDHLAITEQRELSTINKTNSKLGDPPREDNTKLRLGPIVAVESVPRPPRRRLQVVFVVQVVFVLELVVRRSGRLLLAGRILALEVEVDHDAQRDRRHRSDHDAHDGSDCQTAA